jgi:hypothetical protein
MSATVGQETVFHEAEKQPLWNDEDAMLQADQPAVSSNQMTAAEDQNRQAHSPDSATFATP